MHTSRAALDRLLDPDYEAVTLSTLRRRRQRSVGNFVWNWSEGSLRRAVSACTVDVRDCDTRLAFP